MLSRGEGFRLDDRQRPIALLCATTEEEKERKRRTGDDFNWRNYGKGIRFPEEMRLSSICKRGSSTSTKLSHDQTIISFNGRDTKSMMMR